MDIFQFVTLVITGFTAGAEFGSYAFVHPVLRRLPREYHLQVEQGLLCDPPTPQVARLYRSRADNTGARPRSGRIISRFRRRVSSISATVSPSSPALREKIEAINKVVYERVNNGVYRAGFATDQRPYEIAATHLFETLDELDAQLGARRYLLGDRMTEADWRLFPTLIRFDAVYHGHFKCNVRRIVDYTNLWPYLRNLYQHDGVAETVNFDHIKRHYYMTHGTSIQRGSCRLGRRWI